MLACPRRILTSISRFPPFSLGMNKARKEALQQRQLCGGSEEIDGKSYQKWGKFPTTQRKNGKSLKNRLCLHETTTKNSKVIEKLKLFYLLQKVIGVPDSWLCHLSKVETTHRKTKTRRRWTELTELEKIDVSFQSGFRFHVVFLVGVFSRI